MYLKSRYEYTRCGIRKAGRAGARKRDAGYEELEGQIRVSEIRDTKSRKSKSE
ncbi:hypothetical protein VCR15J2_110033 [Vibrio coralliirubri]|nr:hypothetical protein VCR15J2_110033 [Vibrio coralliirubri]